MSPVRRRTSGDWLEFAPAALLIIDGARAGRDGVDGSGGGGSVGPPSGRAMIGTSITCSARLTVTEAGASTIETPTTGTSTTSSVDVTPWTVGSTAASAGRPAGPGGGSAERPRRSPSSTAT